MSFELIWRGRLHFGDEPGVYGDAHYVGLCSEWPVTCRRFDPSATAPGQVELELQAEDVRVFSSHPGHHVTVWRWQPSPTTANPSQWTKVQIADAHLLTNQLTIGIVMPPNAATTYLSVRLEVDGTVHPGLFDEFVVTRLSMSSTTHYASFGFIFEDDPTHDV